MTRASTALWVETAHGPAPPHLDGFTIASPPLPAALRESVIDTIGYTERMAGRNRQIEPARLGVSLILMLNDTFELGAESAVSTPRSAGSAERAETPAARQALGASSHA